MNTPSSDNYSAVFAAVAAMEADAAAFSDEIKVLVLRQITVEGIETLLKHHLYPQRLRPVVEFGGYGTMAQDVLAPDGPLDRLKPDLIVLALSLDELDPNYGSPGWTQEAARAELAGLFELLASRTTATIAVHNFIAPLWPEQGLVVDPRGRDLASQVDELNRFVAETVRTHAPRFVLMDWQRTLQRLGAEAALDERGRYLWRAPFRRPFLDAWAQQLARVARALKGRTKKVLVLDCDNTLWGGVVGEDGMEGIRLDGHQHPGRAFVDFQTSVLHLAERGVLITLCSKNNEADVFEVLDNHPWCRIKRTHLAGWRINWRDKASNIAELAEELNLGLDAFVFVDDNPAECALVSQMLPQVTVLQVPKKLHELPPLLLQTGLFDSLHITDEDRNRARLYQGESQRKSARGAFGDIDEYLQSLQTAATIRLASAAEIPRVAQLTQKTNQFNLTTRRYAEPEVRQLANDPDAAVYSLSARDRFGSLGLVGVLFVRFSDDVARIDTFLMSCRALGRRLEAAMVEHCLADITARRPVLRWEAEYNPSSKNAQVADFWPKQGFAEISVTNGRKLYVRAGDAAAQATPTYITIEQD
nr:HAD-IIIC family phosphatase [uncultured Roseateles sp.]